MEEGLEYGLNLTEGAGVEVILGDDFSEGVGVEGVDELGI